jgi:acyl carrier protein
MMEQRIRAVLGEHARLADDAQLIDVNADLYQRGLTSHASVNVMLALEEEFAVEFEPAMLRKRTFQSIAAISGALSSLPTVMA